MKIPSVLYGSHAEVSRNTRAKVLEMQRVRSWDEWPPFVETAGAPGVLVLGAVPDDLADGPHFFLGEPARWLPLQALEAVFEDACQHPWSLLTLTGDAYEAFLGQELRRVERYLAGIVEFWEFFEAAQGRYVGRDGRAGDLWSASATLRFASAALGIGAAELARRGREGPARVQS